MDLHEYMDAPVIIREKLVEFGRDKYRLKGSSDVTALQESIFLDQRRAETKALHFGTLTGSKFEVQMARYVLLVTACIEPTKYDPNTDTWSSCAPYDESVIANVAAKNSALFISLMAGAHEVFGLTQESAFNQVAAGNSDAPDQVPPSLSSTSGSPEVEPVTSA